MLLHIAAQTPHLINAGVLASSDTTDQKMLAAIKFLGHWTSDLHQPLHPGFQDDRAVMTLVSSCESLHTPWDGCIVEEWLGCMTIAYLVHGSAPRINGLVWITEAGSEESW